MVKCMNIKLGTNDVKITAKLFWKDKADKESTLAFLSYLSSVFYEASEWNKEHGYQSCSETLKENANYLYNVCKEAGLYKKYEQQ